jgi:hypothetical protein
LDVEHSAQPHLQGHCLQLAVEVGEDTCQKRNRPAEVNNRRAAALRFDDPTVQALLSVLLMFCLLPQGFHNRDLRGPLTAPLGCGELTIPSGSGWASLKS